MIISYQIIYQKSNYLSIYAELQININQISHLLYYFDFGMIYFILN